MLDRTIAVPACARPVEAAVAQLVRRLTRHEADSAAGAFCVVPGWAQCYDVAILPAIQIAARYRIFFGRRGLAPRAADFIGGDHLPISAIEALISETTHEVIPPQR